MKFSLKKAKKITSLVLAFVMMLGLVEGITLGAFAVNVKADEFVAALKGKFNICLAFRLQNRTSYIFHIHVLFRCTYPHPVSILLLPVLL